jgi:hypothetical protein
MNEEDSSSVVVGTVPAAAETTLMEGVPGAQARSRERLNMVGS